MTSLLEHIVAGEAPPLVRLTAEQYHRLTESGVLAEGSPVEFIDGFLIYKDRRDSGSPGMNHGPLHSATLTLLEEAIRSVLLGFDFHLRGLLPVKLPCGSEPEPDVAVVRGKPREYTGRIPQSTDTLLVAEVADSSLAFDRTTKLEVYSRSGIPVYWIVDLRNRAIEVHTQPVPGEERYAEHRAVTEGTIELVLGSDRGEIDVADVLA